MLIIFLVTNESFRQPNNLLNILQQSSIIGIVACGMAVMIIAGGFDLSVGAIGAASTMAGAAIMTGTGSIPLGVLGGIAVGLVAGTFNGLLVSRARITPFVATLGSSTIILGIIYASTNAAPISGIPPEFTQFGLGKIAGIPIPAIVFAGVALLIFVVLKWTKIGHYVYAVGSSREASRLAGVPVQGVLLFTFIVGGTLAGLAGLVLLGQTSIGQPTAGTTWPLTAIAAVVVGGTPLRGGTGGVHSAVIGTLLLGVLANALNLYGVSPYWQPAVTGAVVLLAVGVDSYQRKSSGGVA
ncbi:ABC transporter permease [Microbacterium aurum]|nr:ABC transporter permease [Microbacterium aurum]MBM7827672.1 ribose/xylose/arabinose/galactoside ABC-type transport system permease subunit [Microbacterium aurum]